MKTYPRTILCPTFQLTDEAAMQCAGVLAKTFGARLLLLRVVDDASHFAFPSESGDYHIRPTDPMDAMDLPLIEGANHECFELFGEPTTGIRDFAIQNDADMVVISNDVKFDGSAALGPRTKRIAECLPCTVIIIKDLSRDSKKSSFAASAIEVLDKRKEESLHVKSWLLEQVNKFPEELPDEFHSSANHD